MINKLPSKLAVVLVVSSGFSQALDLQSGVIARGQDTIRTEEQAFASVELTKIIQANGGYHGGSLGYTNLGEGDVWYRLYRNLSIGSGNIATGDYLGNWPLIRWEHEFIEPDIEESYLDGYFPSPYSRDYIDDSDRLTHLMGCMQRTPLRYGDVTGDGQAELVVLLADQVSTDINVFSPHLQRTIFSAKLNFTDSVPRSSLSYDSRVEFVGDQFLSWRSAQGANLDAARRAYAKLYAGDFDENGQPDMIVWRKQYHTRRTDDAVEGFELKEQAWLHYTLIDGEYQPVETDEVTIQGWLAANNLTWSQGYPRVSECGGEEGQLIPEMHDPLLNDPDVMQ